MYPVLLANGNRVESTRNGSQHSATFVDPYPKPSYLFALVAGNLTTIQDKILVNGPCEDALASFYDLPLPAAMETDLGKYCREFPRENTTARNVTIGLWGVPGSEDRMRWALASAKKSFLWDEVRFGRIYDLDEFHIVACEDFNAGAMENKGLNIFNRALIDASPTISTDAQFDRVRGVVAHEYFHNWSGDRVTVR